MSDDKTILDYFYDNVEKLGDRTFMTQPMGGDEVLEFSFNETLAEAKKMAGYIKSLNLPEKSQIAICSKNCAWWTITDLAIMMSGNVSVPVYPTLTADTTKYIIEHSESKMVFIGKLDVKPWGEMKSGIPSGLPTVAFPLCPDDHGADKTWADAMEGVTPLEEPVKRTREDMATIIYTSGSTGKPKGVMHSFASLIDPCHGFNKSIGIKAEDRYLSYLPVAHGMERWLGIMLPLYSGCNLFYAESLATFAADLQRCRPTVFLSVPRLWTKFQAGVFSKLSEKKLNILLAIPIISFLIKKKLLKALGLDQCRLAGSGSAPLPPALLSWYRRLGLELLEGYGMTENFNYSHLSRMGKGRPGYVGNTYDDVEDRIAEDGEIQVKTPGKMMGYFKNPEATKEAITEDGWVRTGDKGEHDDKGRLKITGRTKEIFKTSKGKYVAPAPIENLFISNHLVELACVTGKAEPQPHVILQLSDGPKAKAAESAENREKIAAELEEYMKTEVNAKIDQHENLDFIAIVKDDWLPENGFLTPTQKIKRGTIEDAYAAQVKAWYGEKKKVIWAGDW